MTDKESCFWCGKKSIATLYFAGAKRRACKDCGTKWTTRMNKEGNDIGVYVGGELVSYVPSEQFIADVKEKLKAERLMCAYCSRQIVEDELTGFCVYISRDKKERHIYKLCRSCEAKMKAGDKEICERVEEKIDSGLYQLGEVSRGYELYGEPIATEQKRKVEPEQKVSTEALRQVGFFTEALEKQYELIDVWKGQKGELWASRIHSTLIQAEGVAPSLKSIQHMAIHELKNGETYFVAKNICELIEMTALTIPDIPLLFDTLPTTNGWVYLEKPFLIEPPSQIEVSPFGTPPRLKAFSWGFQYTKKEEVTDGIGMTFYEDGVPVPYPVGMCNWGFGVNWGSDWENIPVPSITKLENGIARKRLQVMRQYVLTLFCFLNQRLIAISYQRATRAAQRRYQKRWAQEAPLIKVILLRIKEYRKEKGENKAVEWSCRWVVRGHWRAQWYRSLGSHKAIWITPYVKGPEKLPLKKPAANLFAVIR